MYSVIHMSKAPNVYDVRIRKYVYIVEMFSVMYRSLAGTYYSS